MLSPSPQTSAESLPMPGLGSFKRSQSDDDFKQSIHPDVVSAVIKTQKRQCSLLNQQEPEVRLTESLRPEISGGKNDGLFFYAHSTEVIEAANTFRVRRFKHGQRPFPTANQLFVQSTRKKSRRVLLFEGKIRQIFGVQLSEETFNTRSHFFLTWLATEEDLQNYYDTVVDGDLHKSEWRAPTIPNIDLVNGQDASVEVVECKIIFLSYYSWMEDWEEGQNKEDYCSLERAFGFDPRYSVFVRTKWEVTGTMLEEFELHAYPFDCQDLKTVLSIKLPNVNIVPSPCTFLKYNQNLSALTGVTVKNVTVEFGTSAGDSSRSGKKYPRVSIVVKVQRKWMSRLDILITVAVLAFLTLVTFVMLPAPDTDIGNRVNYLMTLILTDVALQQSVNDKFDDFEYLTIADKYILSAFFFKVGVLVWVCIPFYPIFNHHPFLDQLKTDKIATWFWVIAYIVFMAFWSLNFIVTHNVEKLKLVKSCSELDADFNEGQHSFSAQLTHKAFSGVHDNRMRNKYTAMIIQGPELEYEDDLEAANEQKLHATNEIDLDIPRSVVISLTLVIAGITWIVLHVLRNRCFVFVWQQLVVQTVVMYATCILTNVLFRGILFNTVKSPLNHDLGMSLAFVAQGIGAIFSMLATKYKLSRDELILEIILVIWYSTRFIGDAIVLYRNWGEEAAKDLYGKYLPMSDKNWFFQSLVQGFCVFISSIPLLMMQSSNNLKGQKNSFEQSHRFDEYDAVSLCFIISSWILLALCYFFGDSRSAWLKERKSSTVHPSLVELGKHVATSYRSLGGLSILSDDTVDDDEDEDDEVEANREDDEDGEKDEATWMDTINPYCWVRYPIRGSEVIFWIGMCILSLEMYPRDVLALLSLLSPTCLFLFHYIVNVALLDVFIASRFGHRAAWRNWMDDTDVLLPFF